VTEETVQDAPAEAVPPAPMRTSTKSAVGTTVPPNSGKLIGNVPSTKIAMLRVGSMFSTEQVTELPPAQLPVV
jgi:hypothetical protein